VYIEFIRDPSREFPVAANAAEVTSLKIWFCKYKTFAPLVAYANLERLEVAEYPDTSLEIIGSLRKLQHLRIVHLPKVTSIDPLKHCAQLISLSLATSPSWDARSRRTTVESLSPLSSLTQLRHLELLGVCSQDGSLTELHSLSGLQTLRLMGYKSEEAKAAYLATGAQNAFNTSM
jgi:hypothetical protein